MTSLASDEVATVCCPSYVHSHAWIPDLVDKERARPTKRTTDANATPVCVVGTPSIQSATAKQSA